MFLTNWHTRLIKRLLFLLVPYSLLRIGFYFYHLKIYKQFTEEEIFESLLLGIRFDLAAICLLNLSIILLSLIPSTNSKFLKFDRYLFVLVNMLGFIMALNDYELFLFTGKRLSFDIFAVTDDILQQLPQMLLYYWYFSVVVSLMGIGLYVIDRKFFKLKPEKLRPLAHTIGGFFIIGLAFIAIRGGLQHKSINVQSAFIQGKNELGHLVLNTPYHFLRTLKNRRIEKANYFKTDDEAKNVILNSRDFRHGFDEEKKYNIVLLILESFSLEYVEKGYTPFLSSLIKESVFLEKHLANGRRSIEVLPSLLCGLPSLLDEPISKSIFQGNKFTCMPELLKKVGYTNYFFHAGARGTMGFESYTLANGFDKYFSKEDYPGNEYDGTWGIYDEPYLSYVAKKLGEMPKPFLAGIFTLSSHQPYSIPDKYKGKFPKGTLEIHESIGYTDFALKEFFEVVRKEPWFKDTIFLITADHTQKLETQKFQNIVGQYRVPFLIYAPGIEIPSIDKVTQHSDIPQTVLDLIGISSEDLPMLGSSVFSQDKGQAINYADGSTYLLIEEDKLHTLDKIGNDKLYHINWHSGELTPQEKNESVKLKANVQYFINGLINNNLSL